MKYIIKISKALIIMISISFIIGLAVSYNEYTAELSAVEIYKTNRLDTLNKIEARQWVYKNVYPLDVQYYLYNIIETQLPKEVNFLTTNTYEN